MGKSSTLLPSKIAGDCMIARGREHAAARRCCPLPGEISALRHAAARGLQP